MDDDKQPPHGEARRRKDSEVQEASDRRAGDRRRFERIQVEVWVEQRKAEELYYLRTADLSIGGAFLEATIPHAPGTRLTLHIPLPPHVAPFELEAEVVTAGDHRGTLGMGVKFLNPTDVFAEALAALGASLPG